MLVALLFTALGTAIASQLEDMQGFQLIMNFLVMPLFFLSGALFPLQGLPVALVTVATVDPLSYGIDAFRSLLINSAHFGLAIDIGVLSGVTLLFLILGSYFFSKIQV
jgi:ABC-2 type transport system permease protein